MISLLRFFIRKALRLFCNEIRIKNLEFTQEKGPLLILANHPDSFLDAIIIGSIYQRKVHFLARGDVFRNPVFGALLRSIGMIPIFRAREGKEHLHKNANTFEESMKIIQNGGAVLLFIEGLCLNTNQLLPFKKGASRLVEMLQQNQSNFTIHVATLAYNDFHSIGKTVHIAFEQIPNAVRIQTAKDRLKFNDLVRKQMEKHVMETVPHKQKNWPIWANFIKPYYRWVERWVAKKTNGTVFYDSVLFAVLFFSFPLLCIGGFGLLYLLSFLLFVLW